MMSIMDLRAISEGYSVDAVEMFGGDLLLESSAELNEVMTGVFDAIQVALSDDAKFARNEMKLAKNAVKNKQKKEALIHIDKAIDACNKVKVAAKDIDDDGFISTVVKSFILGIIPYIGAIATSVEYVTSWINLRNQSDKGAMKYSNRHPNREKNLVLEYLFGGIRAAGYSRAQVLAGLDKMINELNLLRNQVKDMKE